MVDANRKPKQINHGAAHTRSFSIVLCVILDQFYGEKKLLCANGV